MGNPEKNKDFSLRGTPKFLWKERKKRTKKQGKSETKEARKSKKARIGGSASFFLRWNGPCEGKFAIKNRDRDCDCDRLVHSGLVWSTWGEGSPQGLTSSWWKVTLTKLWGWRTSTSQSMTLTSQLKENHPTRCVEWSQHQASLGRTPITGGKSNISTQTKKVRLNKFFWTSPVGFLTFLCSFCHLYFVKKFPRFGRKISANLGKSRLKSAKDRPKVDPNSTKDRRNLS